MMVAAANPKPEATTFNPTVTIAPMKPLMLFHILLNTPWPEGSVNIAAQSLP
jgi:hypothetical protein